MRRNRSSGNRAERALGFRWIVAVERFAKLELRDNCPRHFGSKRCSRPRHRLCSGILGLTFATGQERSTSPWPVVTPESQGFDSGVLAELLEHVRTKGTAAAQSLADPKRAADSRRLALSVLTRGSARRRVGDEEHHLGARRDRDRQGAHRERAPAGGVAAPGRGPRQA